MPASLICDGAQYTVNNDPKTMLVECETLMLDMDGTVLDLAYDNYVWKELVPEQYAKATGITVDDARSRLFEKYRAIQGDIQWYCLDHWSERLGLDVLELHREVEHRLLGLIGVRGERNEMLLELGSDVGSRDDALHEGAALASQLAAELDQDVLVLRARALLRRGVGRLPVEGPAIVEVGVAHVPATIPRTCETSSMPR